MKEILLTYVVPVYNTAPYVVKCLQSIVNQGIDEADYEVVVVDDGSPDNSKAIIQEFITTHPQVRLISQANAGLSAARNTGIDNARGLYLNFVDSDDYLEPGMMEPLLRRAVEENLDMLLFNYVNVDSEGKPMSGPVVKHATTPVMTGYEYLSAHAMIPYAWLFLLSRDHINRMGLRFDTSLRYCEDGPFSARILPNAERVAFNDAVVYCYVNRENSIMHDTDIEHLRRRMNCQVDAAASINEAITAFEAERGLTAPASVAGMRNVYLYFAMTKALTCGCVDEILQRIRQAGLYPFPCVGPEANYFGKKWKIIHALMMRPRLWRFLSSVYRVIKR